MVMNGFEWLWGSCRWLRVVTSGYVRLWGGYKRLGLVTNGLKSIINVWSLCRQFVMFSFMIA